MVDMNVFNSSNGTYINGELIGELGLINSHYQHQACVFMLSSSGKNKKRVLNSDDEIALSLNKNKGMAVVWCDRVVGVSNGWAVAVVSQCSSSTTAPKLQNLKLYPRLMAKVYYLAIFPSRTKKVMSTSPREQSYFVS